MSIIGLSMGALPCCAENLIERLFGKLKQFRGIATRYDKLARNFLGAIRLVAAVIQLN
jgi:transposase